MQPGKPVKQTLRFIWAAVTVLTLIGIAAVLRRTLILTGAATSFNPAGGPLFDNGITRRPLLTFVHILPGALFMILGPLQFIRNIRLRRPALHRWLGRVFVVCGYVVGISALVMSFLTPIGGVNETAATTLYAILLLAALTLALRHILQGRVALHREWMIRTFAIGLAVATVRPIVGLFFAFSGLPPQVFFGTAFWIGFTLHLVLAEVWINYTRVR